MQHPITPPPKLLQQWVNDATFANAPPGTCPSASQIAIQAARWGADQELAACCEWLRSKDILEPAIEALRADRRPKPLSLKQQALNLLPDRPGGIAMKCTLHPDDIELLRRALESLPDPQD